MAGMRVIGELRRRVDTLPADDEFAISEPGRGGSRERLPMAPKIGADSEIEIDAADGFDVSPYAKRENEFAGSVFDD